MRSVLQGSLVYHWVNNLHLYSILKSDRQITLETNGYFHGIMVYKTIKNTRFNFIIFLTCPHIKLYSSRNETS